MYIWGTANPAGMANDYDGFYFTQRDLQQCIDNGQFTNKPVKIEHKGVDIGRIVSAWMNSRGQLDCVLEVDENIFEGHVASGFIDDGKCRELSLGYVVRGEQSGSRGPGRMWKEINEVSIVKRGARPSCYIHGFTTSR